MVSEEKREKEERAKTGIDRTETNIENGKKEKREKKIINTFQTQH